MKTTTNFAGFVIWIPHTIGIGKSAYTRNLKVSLKARLRTIGSALT